MRMEKLFRTSDSEIIEEPRESRGELRRRGSTFQSFLGVHLPVALLDKLAIAWHTRLASASVMVLKVGRFTPCAAKPTVTGSSCPRFREPSRNGGSLCRGMKK